MTEVWGKHVLCRATDLAMQRLGAVGDSEPGSGEVRKQRPTGQGQESDVRGDQYGGMSESGPG